MTLADQMSRPPHVPLDWLLELESRLQTDWRPDEWDGRTYVFTGDPENPRTTTFRCPVIACHNVVDAEGCMCSPCRRGHGKAGHPPMLEYYQTHNPQVRREHPQGGRSTAQYYAQSVRASRARNQFDLSGLPPTLRAEILYGLQRRDADGFMVAPSVVRRLLAKLPSGSTTLMDLPDGFDRTVPAIVRGLLRGLALHAKRLHADLLGTDLTEGDVWEPALIGLTSAPNRDYPAAFGYVDFRPIKQAWLRDLIKSYGRAVRPPTTDLQRIVASAVLASQVLEHRPRGDEPTRLGMDDMSAVVRAFATACHPDGKPYSTSHRHALLGYWRRTLDFCRHAGLMDQIPGSFAVHPKYHVIPIGEARGDDLGRAIPEHVIAQLDQNLHLINQSSFSQFGWTSDDFAEMYVVVYKLLRDTGRRPNEIVSLRRTCLEWVDGRPTLIWDNHKRRRFGRRLPIHTDTAVVITDWLDRLSRLPVRSEAEEWLFPAPGSRKRPRAGHLVAQAFGSKIWRAWVDAIADLHDPGLAADGKPIATDRSIIVPYGLRHAYAQRHADNGVDIEILCELMDHKSIETTRGYYTVSLDRKRKAIDKVAGFTVDRHGNAAPPADPLNYERESVTVPFGNCLEPSNVKAGGNHCPIRYQCAGCAHYRPDPSYLPAIEEHIAALVADRETAQAADTAPWVVDNLRHEADAYRHVANTMRAALSDLPSAEQEAIAAAGSLLRRDRASRPQLPFTVLNGPSR